ncbi:DUF6114 domain-containing protein [Streptomyces luteolus]|uniref:DUF6114 domain-containing protein n=1 Tax=Streptomyces luteolus TaxID=3043615 RepID=A0ABT6SNX0_9ACTN|nr:DUF6114 domain-containing protein [Streptomyces sp. B-S-A12]MDI3417240.1 DUF6114 domain-containing protein [Streptomyces sp. B-S-A12]
MSAVTEGPNDHFLTIHRRKFKAWRGGRPFWAGLLTILGGLPIAYLPYGNIKLGNLTLAMATTAGAGSLIIGVLLIVLGLTMWFQQHSRVFAGVAAILLALVSLVVSNIGGFLVGFLLALIGGALGISWAPAGDEGGRGAHRSRDSEGPATDDDRAEPAVNGALDDLTGTGSMNQTNGRHRAG